MLILWIVFQGEDDDADIESVDFPKFVLALGVDGIGSPKDQDVFLGVGKAVPI